jgi:hypothetical protein
MVAKGFALAMAPVVFDQKISAVAQVWLITIAYTLILVSFVVLLSVFRNYEQSSRFRDDLAIEERELEERAKALEAAEAGQPHDFEHDPRVPGYYRVIPGKAVEQ